MGLEEEPTKGVVDKEAVSQSLSDLKTLRSTTKGSMTRIRQTILTKKDSLSLSELECRLGILESYFKQIMSAQVQIERMSAVADAVSNLKSRNEIEDLYIETKSEILSLVTKIKATLSPDTLNASFAPPQTVVRSNLQCQKIPHFTGKYSDYPKLIGIFRKLVHNNLSLDNLERFNYLLESLGGAALAAVKEFEVNELNYAKAIQRLQDRFDNKNLLLQEHLKGLFELPKVSKGSSFQLRSLVDSVNSHFSAMESIGSMENIANALIIYLVCEKLDSESLVKWEESIDYTTLSSWKKCEEVLSRRCQNLEVRESKLLASSSTTQVASQNTSQYPSNSRRNKMKHSGSSKTTLVVAGTSCLYCSKTGHSIEVCFSFKNLSVVDRFNEVKKRMLCLNCLALGHTVRKCSASKCQVCGGPHHLLLHRYSDKPAQENSVLVEPEEVNPVQSSLHSSLVEIDDDTQPSQVILATAIVQVKDSRGEFHEVRALLDSASQLNFITESVGQRLHLRKLRRNTVIAGVGKNALDVKYGTHVAIQSRVTSFDAVVEALILPAITNVHPELPVNIEDWKVPQNVQLADPHFHRPSSVDLLLGADLFYNLLSVGQIKLGDGKPTLQKTVLGWVVSGRVKPTPSRISSCYVVSECNSGETTLHDFTLDELVEQFWKIETIQPNFQNFTEEETLCEKYFESTVRRNQEGRFIVKLPFKQEEGKLGQSFSIAERRFIGLEKRLNKQAALKEQYAAFMKEYLEMGHMKKIPRCNHSLVKYITPHQCVLRPDSSTTKLRVVFDCSTRTSSNLSLNDVLLKGPVVQDELFSIVLRFRCYKYALTADISKMYRQVLVDERDTYYQCILWRDSPSAELEIYRLMTVTYGTSSAPYLATRCLNYLADCYRDKYPVGSDKIRKDFYVDDLITGANSIEEIKKIHEEVCAALKQAKFDIRKWYSNEPTFLSQVPEEERETPLRINDKDVIKALGVIWDPASDMLCYVKPNITPSTRVTMRGVLKEMSQLFDPLGLISPVIVRAKIFMQDLWISKVKWDESLSQELHTKWVDFKNELDDLKQIRVERCIIPSGEFDIHGFADASGRAFGCCIYIRHVVDGKVCVNLFSAKSRVAPVRVQAIPRLELCAAELLVQLLQKVLRNVPNRVGSVTLWTDSEIVLHWLAKHPSTWETFVANRVSRVQQASQQATWRHVGSKSNPADIVSRGAGVLELPTTSWFKGPSFLYKDESEWPKSKVSVSTENLPGTRKVKTSLLSAEIKQEFAIRYTRFPDIQKTLRIFSYARRFITGCRRQKLIADGRPVREELDAAFMRIIWNVQQTSFPREIEALKKGKEPPKQGGIQSLSPFLETSVGVEILRVGGRLRVAELHKDTKHPILLPKNNLFVRYLVRYLHVKHLHAGPQALVAIIRQRFWIVNCRALALSIVRKCILCFKYRPRLYTEVMGDLPKNRTELTKPFLISGVDFCGPQYITEGVRGRPPRKVYVAVFVCFGCKAVHLEVVSDLTSRAFIAALKRFVGRRGIPDRIYCDNATNFVGARRELEELKRAFYNQQVLGDIQAECAEKGIEFKHIPPRAPHFGGLWEAAVKSFKYHFRRVLSKSLLTFEELSTLVVEIESILNSRALIPMSADPNDDEVLTPGHFLIGALQRAVPEPILEEPKSIGVLERWKRVSILRQHFWDRWRKEYVLELQSKAKWRKAAPKEIKPDTLVLVFDDNLPSNQWLVGRVIQVIKGSDGKVRVVDLKTKSGVIRRAVHRVAVLPTEGNC